MVEVIEGIKKQKQKLGEASASVSRIQTPVGKFRDADIFQGPSNVPAQPAQSPGPGLPPTSLARPSSLPPTTIPPTIPEDGNGSDSSEIKDEHNSPPPVRYSGLAQHPNQLVQPRPKS